MQHLAASATTFEVWVLLASITFYDVTKPSLAAGAANQLNHANDLYLCTRTKHVECYLECRIIFDFLFLANYNFENNFLYTDLYTNLRETRTIHTYNKNTIEPQKHIVKNKNPKDKHFQENGRPNNSSFHACLLNDRSIFISTLVLGLGSLTGINY